jgi:hypothetical protein
LQCHTCGAARPDPFVALQDLTLLTLGGSGVFHQGMRVDHQIRETVHPRRDVWLALAAAVLILLAFGAKAAFGL